MDVSIFIFLGGFLSASAVVGYDTMLDERQPVTFAPNRHLYPAENEFLSLLEEAQKDLVTKGTIFVMQTSKNTTDILSSITPSQFATLQVIRSLASGEVGISGMLIGSPIFGNNTEMDWLDRYFQFDQSLVYDIAKTTCEITGASETILDLVMMLSQKYEVLNRAAEEGNDKLIKCLLASGINLTETGPKAVVTAWSKDRPDAVSLLLENNALNDLRSMKNIVKVTNSRGQTLLHFAGERGLMTLAKTLIDNGAQVDVKDNEFLTTFYLAVENKHKELARLLLSHGANSSTKTLSGDTLLHLAAKKRSDETVRGLLEFGPDLEAKNEEGITALYFAAEAGDQNIIDMLLKAGANPLVETNSGNSLLHVAAMRGNFNAVKHLLKSGAEINRKNREGLTPLFLAAENGTYRILQFLLYKGATCKDLPSGDTLLHTAANRGNLRVITSLIDQSLAVDSINRRGLTPLYSAAEAGVYSAMDLLVSKGGDMYVTLGDGRRLLHVAAAEGNVVAIESLLHIGTYVDVKDVDGLTPLCRAVQADNLVSSGFLIDKGSNTSFRSTSGNSLLHIAAASSSYECTQLLIEHGLPIDAENEQNETALYIAAQNKNKTLADLLIALGANKNYFTKSGDSLVHIAVQRNQLEVLKYLANVGSDMNAVDSNGFPPLYCAISQSKFKAADFLLEVVEGLYYREEETLLHLAARNGEDRVVSYFVNKGYYLDIKDSNGTRPVDLALRNGHCDVALMLLKKGADINGRNGDKRTVLHEAVGGKCTSIFSALIENVDDFDPRDYIGQTPLHLAAFYGEASAVGTLILLGADPNAQDINRDTPVQLAVRNKHWDTALGLINQDTNVHILYEHNRTILHLALLDDREDVIDALLERTKCDINAIDDSKQTPLDLALNGIYLKMDHTDYGPQRKKWNIIRTILKNRGNVQYTDNDNRTILHSAVLDDQMGIIEYLISKTNYDVNALDKNEQTPLHLASLNGRTSVAKYLIKNGAILNIRDINGKQPIRLAAENNHWDVVFALAKRRADVTWTDENKRTLLHLASFDGKAYVIKALFLLPRIPNINARDANLQSPLHLAALNNNYETINVLLSNGADWHAEDNQDMTPLILAVSNNSWDAVYRLLDKEVEVDWVDDLNRTLLHLASFHGKINVIERLCSGTRNTNVDPKDVNFQTPLHLAALNNNYDTVDYLLNYGADRHAVDNQNRTPLILAVTKYNWGAVNKLLKYREEVDWVDSLNRTLLHLASLHGQTEVIELLLSWKINTNVNARDANLQTPLHLAALSNNYNTVNYLLNYGADIHAVDSQNMTSIALAATNNNWVVVNRLIDYGAEVDWVDSLKRTLLHLASLQGKTRLIQHIFSLHRNTNVNARDANLQTPLHLAALNNNHNAIEVLLNYGADKHIVDNQNRTPLIVAVTKNYWDVVQRLLDNEIEVDWVDTSNRTLLHLALMNERKLIFDYLIENTILKVNSRDVKHQTVLHLAAIRDYPFICDILVSKGADKSLVDTENRTPLILAATNNSWEAVYKLLDNDVDIEWRDRQNRTLFHLAAQEGQTDIVEYLIENTKININIFDANLQTPLHLAAVNNKYHTVEFLLKNGADKDLLDNNNNSALIVAVFNSSWDAACSLLNPNGNMEWTDSKNRTLLHLAAMGGGGKLIDCLTGTDTAANALDANGETALDLLIQNGHLDIACRYSYIDWRDGKGSTLLHLFTHRKWYNEFNSYEIRPMKWNYDSVDYDLRNPLHTAVLNDNFDAFRHFLYYCRTPNAKDIKGQTPLHLAAANGQTGMIEEMFSDSNSGYGLPNPAKSKIKVNTRDNLGRTPLQLSLDNGHKETVLLLRKYGAII